MDTPWPCYNDVKQHLSCFYYYTHCNVILGQKFSITQLVKIPGLLTGTQAKQPMWPMWWSWLHGILNTMSINKYMLNEQMDERIHLYLEDIYRDCPTLPLTITGLLNLYWNWHFCLLVCFGGYTWQHSGFSPCSVLITYSWKVWETMWNAGDWIFRLHAR